MQGMVPLWNEEEINRGGGGGGGGNPENFFRSEGTAILRGFWELKPQGFG